MTNSNSMFKITINIDYIICGGLSIFTLLRAFTITSKPTMLLGFAAALFGLLFVYKNKREFICIYDIMVILLATFILLNSAKGYERTLCVINILAYIYYFLFKTNVKYAQIAMTAILFFSIANFFANLIQITSSHIYYSIINKIFYDDMVAESIYWFNKEGFLSGLAEHYSRNAYYCVIGLSVLVAYFFSGQRKHKRLVQAGIACEFLLMLKIGKRGHLLFCIAAVFMVYLFLEPNISKRIGRLIKFIILGLVSLAFVMEFIPSVGFVFERMVSQFSSGDFTTGRITLYQYAWNKFLEHPILGNGYGSFSTYSVVVNGDVFAGVHNDYLQWLCEGGILGFCVNMFAAVLPYSLALKELKLAVRKKISISGEIFTALIWSLLFQTFVLLYSLTGLPHFDYEINGIYMIACSVPIAIAANNHIPRIRIRKVKII